MKKKVILVIYCILANICYSAEPKESSNSVSPELVAVLSGLTTEATVSHLEKGPTITKRIQRYKELATHATVPFAIIPLSVALVRQECTDTTLACIEAASQEELSSKHGLACSQFHRACKYGNGDVIATFLKKCPFIDDVPTVNITDIFGRTPLHCAVLENNKVVVEELIKEGATVDIQIPTNPGISDPQYADNLKTSLHFAAQLGYSDMILLLLQHGANPFIKDLSGRTPRMLIGSIRVSDFQLPNYNKCKKILLEHEIKMNMTPLTTL